MTVPQLAAYISKTKATEVKQRLEQAFQLLDFHAFTIPWKPGSLLRHQGTLLAAAKAAHPEEHKKGTFNKFIKKQNAAQKNREIFAESTEK